MKTEILKVLNLKDGETYHYPTNNDEGKAIIKRVDDLLYLYEISKFNGKPNFTSKAEISSSGAELLLFEIDSWT
jgi:hypothetical protein